MAEVNRGIDFLKITKKSVQKLFRKHKISTVKNLSDLQSFCYDPNNGKRYHKHIKTFLVQAGVERVWQTYKTIPPHDTWNGNMVSFGMMYSRGQNTTHFPGDAYEGIEPGQLLFLNLNLLANKLNLAVGHEVVAVHDDSRQITICYVQNGASVGTQVIRLKSLSPNQTEVVHETWYRSGSWLRDKVLYPIFHERAITEFHTNVKRKAEQL